MRTIVAAYIVAVAGAEALVALQGVVSGIVCHAILIQVFLVHYVLISQPSQHDIGNPNASHWFATTLPVLALSPLLRILSVAMPVRGIPEMYWYVMIGAPLLLAVALVARLLDLSVTSLGLSLWLSPWQILISLTGFPLGSAAYLILRPEPLVVGWNWLDIVTISVILIVFTGFTEEIIFRGMLLRIFNELFGRMGMLWSGMLFASLYLGSRSPGYVLFVGLVGIFFGWCVNRTNSLWGVIFAHGLYNVVMLVMCPTVVN